MLLCAEYMSFRLKRGTAYRALSNGLLVVVLCLNNTNPPKHMILVWFDFCFTALQHILGHFGRSQLTYPHCSWASLLGSLPVLSAHSFASNCQLLFLNQRKRENAVEMFFMTKSPETYESLINPYSRRKPN